jgi:flagellar motor switch protein FliM
MADILSQEEVDLLLSAVTEGESEIESGEFPRIDAAESPDLLVYDFRRPERVSKEQLKGLQGLFEAFAREVSIVLPPFLRTVVRVDLVSIDQLTYDEFILSVSRPTALSVINMNPLDGSAVLETSLDMVFPIIDRVLGGSGAMLDRQRELTEIEMRIVNRIILMMLDCLKRSWQQLVEFKMSVVNQESDPLIVQIVGGGEMVILVGYEVYVGERVGQMNWCVPLMVLNPVLDQITAQTHYRRHMTRDMAQRVRAQLHRLVMKSVVPVDAVLGRSRLPLSELSRLQVGDVVKLDTDVKDSFTVEAGGIPRFKATLGRRGEQSAVQVKDLIRD